MNILLTGYAGNLGTSLIKYLRNRGWTIRVLLHGAAIKPHEVPADLEVVWGSLSDGEVLERLTRNIDVVIHSAWQNEGKFRDDEDYVNLRGTLALIQSAEKNGVKTFIHVSSVGVYGLNKRLWGSLVDESTPLVSREDAMNAYPWIKVLLEYKCREMAGSLKMNLMVIRPGLLFSDKKIPAKKLKKMGNINIAFLVGNGNNHLPYIHVDDVSDLIMRMIEKPVKYDIYNCTPSEHVGANSLVKNWGRHGGISVHIIKLYPVYLKFMHYGLGLLKQVLGRPKGGNVNYQIMTGIRNIRYSSDKAKKNYNWQDTITKSIANM